MGGFYNDPKFGVAQQAILPGNDFTTHLLTPQAGTGAETKTHTTTLKPWFPQRNITLKKLAYNINTAQTGAGNNLTLDVYNGTTSVGSLAVTTETAGSLATMSADVDSVIAATGANRVLAHS